MALHTLFGSSMSCHSLFRVLLSLLFISTLLHSASACKSTNTTNSQLKVYKKFIFNQCNSTTYPKVCYKSLTPYASKIKTNRSTLTRTSVYLALKAARSSSKTLTKLSSSKKHIQKHWSLLTANRILRTLDLLEQSVDGILRLNGTTTDDEKFQWDNIKTWMSAAITDETTCTDEFDEMEVGASLHKIKTSVGNLAWLTSNALALVNRLTF